MFVSIVQFSMAFEKGKGQDCLHFITKCDNKKSFKFRAIYVSSFDKANNEDEDLMDIFRVFDQEGKGCINVNELRNVWNNYLMDDIPSQEVDRLNPYVVEPLEYLPLLVFFGTACFVQL